MIRVYIKEITNDYVLILSRIINRPEGWSRSEWVAFWERCKHAEETP